MATVQIELDLKAMERRFGELSRRGLAYAAANAINNTAKLVQAAERERLDDVFTVRTPQTRTFLERQIAKIKPFASVRDARPFAEISVGQAKRLQLSIFEKGGDKEPSPGRKLVGVPITGGPARLSFSSPVAETLYLRKLRFKAKRTQTGKVQLRGQLRTFILKRTAQSTYGGVYQRVGPKRDDVRLVYSFKQRPRLRAVLGFVKTADEVGRRWLKREFEQQLQMEIERASRRA